jgi:hypothetical protein
MPHVGFEPMIPVLERAKTVYALDRAATVVSATLYWTQKRSMCASGEPSQRQLNVARIVRD